MKGIAESAGLLIERRTIEIQERIGEIAEGAARLERTWNDWTKQHTDSNRRQFLNVDNGFKAVFDRETLASLAEAIELEANWLLRTRDGQAVENWGNWSAREKQWSKSLSDYCHIARRYRPEVSQSIREVLPSQLTGEWPEDENLFPNSDAMIAHRTVAATLVNFQAQHQRVMASVTSSAFEAPSQKGGL